MLLSKNCGRYPLAPLQAGCEVAAEPGLRLEDRRRGRQISLLIDANLICLKRKGR